MGKAHFFRRKMQIREYVLQNDDLEVKFLNLGAIITEINFKGINRVLRFEELSAYANNTMYLGAIVGRTAGRIKDGVFSTGQLSKNYLGKHNLHGNDLNKCLYDVQLFDNYAVLKYTDLEGDYPGDLDIEIKFELKDNSLLQTIKAECNKPTLINMTNHTYFNLNGEGSILDHELKISANKVGILNTEMLTEGLADVDNTAFDFRNNKVIEKALIQGDPQFKISGFIDHPYLLTGDIKLKGKNCTLTIETNQPYVVAYLGSQISTEPNKLLNNQNNNYVGLCLEPQKCPGDIELVDTYVSNTLYRFE